MKVLVILVKGGHIAVPVTPMEEVKFISELDTACGKVLERVWIKFHTKQGQSVTVRNDLVVAYYTYPQPDKSPQERLVSAIEKSVGDGEDWKLSGGD